MTARHPLPACLPWGNRQLADGHPWGPLSVHAHLQPQPRPGHLTVHYEDRADYLAALDHDGQLWAQEPA